MVRFPAVLAAGAFACTPVQTPSTNADPWASPAAPPPGAAPTAPPAPAAGTGGFDLAYEVPAGWTETREPDAIVLYRREQHQEGTDFYGVDEYRLLILPSRPLGGALPDAYRAVWAEQVVPLFETTLQPAPMRRRLASGLALGVDGDSMIARSSGGRLVVNLYLVAARDRAVPVLGLYTSWGSDRFAGDLERFFATATIRGGEPDGGPLYADAEVVGAWSTSAATYADYVDSRGDYAGNASAAFGESYELGADRSFASTFAGVRGSGTTIRQKSTGSWRIENDNLVFEKDDGSVERHLLRGIGPAPGAGVHALALEPNYDGAGKVHLANPRAGFSLHWYGRR